MLAAVNRGFLKKVTSSIGWSVVFSHTTKPTSNSTPMVPTTMVSLLPQPFEGASMMA